MRQPEPRFIQGKDFGRIRVFEDTAMALDAILRLERDRLSLQRRTAIETEPNTSTSLFNRQIKLVDQLLDELERTRVECGWIEAD